MFESLIYAAVIGYLALSVAIVVEVYFLSADDKLRAPLFDRKLPRAERIFAWTTFFLALLVSPLVVAHSMISDWIQLYRTNK